MSKFKDSLKAHLKSAALGVAGGVAGFVGMVVGLVTSFIVAGGSAATLLVGALGSSAVAPTAVGAIGLATKPPKKITFFGAAAATFLGMTLAFNAVAGSLLKKDEARAGVDDKAKISLKAAKALRPSH